MYLFAVIGKPIAHSLSPEIHHAFAKHHQISAYYKKILSTERAFTKIVTNFLNNGGHGLNITVPFKQQAYVLCGENITHRAKVARSVNTLFIQNNILYGDNTDGAGLIADLAHLGWNLEEMRVAIVGAGGAARGVVLPLLQAGVRHITIANRTVANAKELVSDIRNYDDNASLRCSTIDALSGEFDLIINATSTGLTGEMLPLSDSLQATYAYDMCYTPKGDFTPFMKQMATRGAEVSDGFGMLIQQAAESFSIWTGTHPNVNEIDFDFLRI